MASIGKPKVRLSAKDLKQAVLKKNKSLEVKNKSLEASIKDRSKELKSLDKEYISRVKKVSQVQRDIEFQEDRLQKINGGVYSSDRLLKAKLKAISEAESELCKYESITEKLEDKEVKLKKDIEALEFYKEKCSNYKNELSSVKAEVSKAVDSLESARAKKDQVKIDHKVKLESYENEYNLLEEKAKSQEDMVCRFEQRLFEAKDQAADEENNLKDILAKAEKEKDEINQELQAIKNLCANTEDEYIKWEGKVNKAKSNVESEVKKKEIAVDNFQKWKIGVLEEVARLKLKSKVDKIDKAGLSEILNG